MSELSTLSAAWVEAKRTEQDAIEARRIAEDRLLSLIGIPETFDGTENAEAPGGYKIKIVGRMNRKVDADLVQEIAAEHGLTDHLTTLFRWTPAINVAAWKNTDANITGPLAAAITTKPGRPSFKIEQENDNG